MTNLLVTYQRAARLFLESNGRVSFRSCMERAALAVRIEQRARPS